MVASNSEIYKSWPELKRVIDEKRCEFVLTSQDLDKREPSINDEKLQDALFQEELPINFLDLSQVNLTVLFPAIARLKLLNNLVLRCNHLKNVPEEIGFLEKLKVLDLSFNQIECLPDSCSKLVSLSTLNLSNNKICKLPDFSALASLQILDLSHNALVEFPVSLPTEGSRIQTLLLNGNNIQKVPETVRNSGSCLKTLDLSENKLCELPLPLAFLPKLKELNLTSNSFTDKRFGKLAGDKRHSAPSMVEYLKKKAPAASKTEAKRGTNESSISEEAVKLPGPSVHINFGKCKVTVTRQEAVVGLRPHIACCLLRNISLDADKMKTFLSLQTKLHDSLCAYRTLATIGTHDCSKISLPLIYTALDPSELKIVPLHKKVVTTARDLVNDLAAEAELLRKKQKRSSYSSIHKYLYLVEKMPKYPCIVDADGNVLSFAPVTNSETTKISEETQEIFVEVTSAESQATCRLVMDRLIDEIINNKLSTNLIVEQIKVFQENGNLLIAYPGKLDLQLPSVSVTREVIKESEDLSL